MLTMLMVMLLQFNGNAKPQDDFDKLVASVGATWHICSGADFYALCISRPDPLARTDYSYSNEVLRQYIRVRWNGSVTCFNAQCFPGLGTAEILKKIGVLLIHDNKWQLADGKPVNAKRDDTMEYEPDGKGGYVERPTRYAPFTKEEQRKLDPCEPYYQKAVESDRGLTTLTGASTSGAPSYMQTLAKAELYLACREHAK